MINYQYLNVDKPGLRQIMDLAVEGGILQEPVDIDVFADPRFGTATGEVPAAQLAGRRSASRVSDGNGPRR